MSKFNEKYFEQKVGYYRQWLTLFFAVEVACIAWLATNYTNAASALIILDIMAILSIFAILALINTKIRNYIKRLRD